MKHLSICLLLGVVVLGSCWTSLPGAFHFDDLPLMLENPRVTAPSFDYGSFAEMYGGRPLTLWTFHLNYRWFGADPAAFHAVNIGLHALAGMLLYLLVLRWFSNVGLAVAASLLFLLHPAQAQIVDYVWARSILLMAVFGLGALLLLVRRHPWWALLCLQLAVWSRAEALVFLVPLILVDRKILKPGLAIAAADLVCFAYGFVLASPAEFAWNYPSWLRFWLQAPLVLLRYLGWMVWPDQFSVFHGNAVERALPLLIGGGFLAGLIALTRVAGRRLRPVWLAVGWTCLFLLPSVLVPNSEPFSENRVYVALAGVAVVAAWMIREAAVLVGGRFRMSQFEHGIAVAAVAVLSIGAFTMTQNRHGVWADDVLLWREAVRSAPDAVLPSYNLAVALSNRGRTAEACTYFARSVDLNPQDDMSYSGLGYCAEVNGQINRATEYYSQALSLNTGNDYAREALDRLGVEEDPGETKP